MADDSRRQKLEDERTVGFIVERNPSDFAIDGPKKKRKRTIITPEQLASLNDFFNREQWPNRARKVKLAHEIGMTENFVSVWFQNKRAKIKRDIEENDKKHARNKRDPHSLPSRQLKPILPSPPKPLCALGVNGSNSTHSNSQNNICAKFSLHDDMSCTFHAKNISSNTEMAAKNVTDSVLDLSIGKVTPRFEPKCSDKFAQPQGDLAKPAQKMPVHVEDQSQNVDCNPNNANVKQGTTEPPTLFKSIINMICLAEGGIIKPEDPEFHQAVTSSLYGIKIGRNERLVYDPEFGLEVERM